MLQIGPRPKYSPPLKKYFPPQDPSLFSIPPLVSLTFFHPANTSSARQYHHTTLCVVRYLTYMEVLDKVIAGYK